MKIIDIQSTPLQEIIANVVMTLKNGGILIYPTETTYGIGVDATNQTAVNKLLNYKGRREGKPFSIAVNNMNMAERYVELNDTARNIYTNFLPGPVTVISKSKNNVALGIASEKGTLGIRIPKYDLILEIIKNFDGAITATSANASNGKAPYKIADILDNISQKQKNLVDLILDAGELPHNNPSTVIDTVSGNVETIRSGDYRFDLKKKFISNDMSQTIEFGTVVSKYIIENLNNNLPTIIAIQGDLGAGKTHFASGVAKGFNIKAHIKSPTYILCNEFVFKPNDLHYNIKKIDSLIFYHIDTYRMERSEELLEIGFNQMISKPNVILIEWANRVIPILDQYKDQCNFIWLRFEYIDDTTRSIFYDLPI